MKATFCSTFLLLALTSFSSFAEVTADIKIGVPFLISDTGEVTAVRKNTENTCLKIGKILKSKDRAAIDSPYVTYVPNTTTCINGDCESIATWEVTCLVDKPATLPLFSLKLSDPNEFNESVLRYFTETTLNKGVSQYLKESLAKDSSSCFNEVINNFSDYKKDNDFLEAQRKITEMIGPFTIVTSYETYYGRQQPRDLMIINSDYSKVLVWKYDTYGIEGKSLSKEENHARKNCVVPREDYLNFMKLLIKKYDKSGLEGLE